MYSTYLYIRGPNLWLQCVGFSLQWPLLWRTASRADGLTLNAGSVVQWLLLWRAASRADGLTLYAGSVVSARRLSGSRG